jgi:hypothetical protein
MAVLHRTGDSDTVRRVQAAAENTKDGGKPDLATGMLGASLTAARSGKALSDMPARWKRRHHSKPRHRPTRPLFFPLSLRQEMRVPLACCGKRAPHRLLDITAVGLRDFVSRESAALTIGQLGFFQPGHAAVPTGIEREKLRHPLDFLTQRLHQLFHARIGPWLCRALALALSDFARDLVCRAWADGSGCPRLRRRT